MLAIVNNAAMKIGVTCITSQISVLFCFSNICQSGIA